MRRNGASKSTLLKILSRITEPTRGRAVLRGRVVSLLEVGTGFHPELTGRENIFLNGAIMGMKRAQISAKLPQTKANSMPTVPSSIVTCAAQANRASLRKKPTASSPTETRSSTRGKWTSAGWRKPKKRPSSKGSTS